MDLSIVVPTFNEAPNIAELVRRISAATEGLEREILFVDDAATTPPPRSPASRPAPLPVRLIHRETRPVVSAGPCWWGSPGRRPLHRHGRRPAASARGHSRDSSNAWRRDADVVAASRYVGGGAASGLADAVRTRVARRDLLTRAMFPIRLPDCTDPMTGFFLVDRSRLDLAALSPRGSRSSSRSSPERIAHRRGADGIRRASTRRLEGSLRQGVTFIAQLPVLSSARCRCSP